MKHISIDTLPSMQPIGFNGYRETNPDEAFLFFKYEDSYHAYVVGFNPRHSTYEQGLVVPDFRIIDGKLVASPLCGDPEKIAKNYLMENVDKNPMIFPDVTHLGNSLDEVLEHLVAHYNLIHVDRSER